MKTQLQLRIDENTKKEASDLYQDLGLTLSDAVNVFLKRSVSVGGFPFEVRKTQYELRMDEISSEYDDYIKSPEQYTSYDNAHDMIEAILDEV